MQNLTYAACSSASGEGQLIDSRDGKIYYVAKLPDKNCWMTQNLDYDDPGGIKRVGDTKPDIWPNDNGMRQYWDPGEKVVSGTTLAAPSSSNTAHNLVGNYYSWSSATMGTGDGASSDGQNVSGSVCPLGWQLPRSGKSVTTSGSFGGLQSAGSIGSTGSKLTQSPYYFQYGGRVDSGSLYDTGSYGYYWSSTAYSAPEAYSLYFYSSIGNPSLSRSRYLGFSVRCLVLGS